MALVDFTPYGVIRDKNALDVGKEFWTDSENIRFREGVAEKMGGEAISFTTLLDPLHLQFSGNHSDAFWWYMSDGNISVTNGTVENDLDVADNVIAGEQWDSALFNLFGIFNNGSQAPFWSDGSSQVAALPGFPDNTTCKVIRPFRDYLVALNLTDTVGEAPNRVLWSDVSDAGAIPQSWDIADPTTLSGDVYLTETKGEIIDGLALRDFFVIYKTHSTVIMSLVGGQQIMAFHRTHINSGILAKDCVTEFKGKHLILTDGDIVLFDGQNIVSIAEDKVRTTVFSEMDSSYSHNSYVRRSDVHKEVWVCYPTQGQKWPNKAAIYNWEDETWSFRDIGEARDISLGFTNNNPSPTYDSLAGVTYDSQAGVLYNNPGQSPTVDLLLKATNFSVNNLDIGNNLIDAPFITKLEHNSEHFGTPERVKLVSKIIPRITAQNGTVIHIRIGTQMRGYDDIVWLPEQVFTVGDNREVDVLGKGRYISFRFRTDQLNTSYKLHGFQVEAKESGRY